MDSDVQRYDFYFLQPTFSALFLFIWGKRFTFCRRKSKKEKNMAQVVTLPMMGLYRMMRHIVASSLACAEILPPPFVL